MNSFLRNLAKQRTWRVALGALLIVAISTSAGIFSALGAGAFGGFLIDGVIPDSGAIQFDDPFGAVDELGPVNASATKLGVIHTASPPMLAFTNPNAQVDLRRAWLDTGVDDNNQIWLYFAWERDSSNGSGVIMFEFQQNAAPAGCDYSVTDQVTPITAAEQTLIDTCNPWANRSPFDPPPPAGVKGSQGDFIIVWDQAGKKIVLTKRTWRFNDTNPNNGDWDGPIAEPLYLDAGVTLSSTEAVAEYSQDKFFGEAAINLSTTVFPPTPTSCFSVANIIPGTVTGNSDTADYKDTILADYTNDIAISNCGELNVTKVTSDGGSGTFPYLVDRSGGGALMYPTNGQISNPTVTEYQISSTLTTSGETEDWTDLLVGSDYVLEEGTVGPLYGLDRIECIVDDDTDNPYVLFPASDPDYSATFPMVASSITSCTITNQLQTGTLTVYKNVVNDNGGSAVASDFTLHVMQGGTDVDDSPAPGSATGKTYTLIAGDYTVSENAPLSGYTETGFSGDCDSNGNVSLSYGENKTCTITNDDQQAYITVVKVVNNNGTGGGAQPDDFDLTLEGNPVSSGVAVPVNPGTYTAAETELPGYTFGGFSDDCDDNGDTTVALGESKTCTLTNNAEQATITVYKVVVNDNGMNAAPDDFDLTLDGVAVSHGVAVDVAPGTYTAGETLLDYYHFAGFSGDCDDNGDVTVALGEHKTCTLTNEDLPADPAGTTDMSWVLHDSLTITDLRSGAPDADDATVTFRLYSDDACSVQVGSDEEIDLSGSFAETVLGVAVSDPGTFYWTAEYSGDQYNNGFTTACGHEVTTIGETVTPMSVIPLETAQERAFAAPRSGVKK